MNVAVRKPVTQVDAGALKARAAQLRGKIIDMSHAAKSAARAAPPAYPMNPANFRCWDA